MSYFNLLKDQLTKGHFNANYKPRFICHLLSMPDFIDTKENIAISLSQVNKDKPHPYFMTHSTVFDVLTNRLGLVEKIGDSYKLKGNFSESQVSELKTLCKSRMEDF